MRKAFRDVDSDARESGRRWGTEIRRGMGDVGVRIDGDINPAQREVRRLDREIEGRPRKVKVDVDKGSMNAAATALRAVSTNLTAVAAVSGTALAPNAIAATGTAVAQLSGVIGLLPATIGTAALAFGSLKIATLGFGDALKEIRDPEKFAEAIAKISPNMQQAATAIQGLLPQIDQLKFTVQDAFGAGLGQQIQALGATYLPMFQTTMSQMAASANSALTQVSQALQTPGRTADMSAMTNNMAVAFDKLSQALSPIVSSFVDIGLVGSGFLPQLADGATRAAQAFSDFIGEARASGDLQGWIQTGIDAFKQLGDIVMNIGGILKGVMTASPEGGGLLGTLQSITQVVNDFVNSPAGQQALNTWMSAVQTAMTALAPAAGALLQALAPLAGVIGQSLAMAIQAIAPSLTAWFTAMQPVISQLSGALMPVIQQIMPVISQLAMTLAGQMITGIQQILPALGPFVAQMGQLLVAVLPLVPPLTQLAISSIPVMQQAIATLLPPLTEWMNTMVQIANVVIPPLAAAVGWVADMFAQRFSAIKDVVSMVWNVVGPILEKMADLIGKVGGFLNIFSSASGNAASALRAAMPQVPTGSLPTPIFTQPQAGGLPGAQRERRGVAPVAPAVGVPMTALPIPAVSSYVAPPPPVKGSSSGGGTTAADFMGGYTSDAALLANVPAGSYSEPGSGAWDLQKGLADCSSSVEDLVNLMDGTSTAGRSMATGNAAEWLSARGFLPGSMPGAFNVGFNSSHMQATLPGGTNFNWGSDAAAARGGVGGTGAFDPAFTQHFYRPVAGGAPSSSPVSSAYPETQFTPTGDPAFDRKGRDAQQKVADRADAVTRAQMKYDQVMASGKSTALQRKTAEDALAKAKREHADAQTDLNTLLEKGNTLESAGTTGGEQFGKDFVSGIGQAFGFGDLFKDPTQFGLFKIFQGVMGLKPKDGGTTDGSMFPSGGGGGPLGGLMSLIPQPFGAVNPGSPADAPGQFMPAMPNGGGGGIVAPGNVMADPNSPPGAAGPGNVNDFRGANFGYSPTAVQDQVNSAHLQQTRQPMRSLPK